MATDSPPNGNGGVVYKLASFRLTVQTSGDQLDLFWPVTGVRLQAQTNSLGMGITTNWFYVPGSMVTNHVTVPLEPDGSSAFYRLASP